MQTAIIQKQEVTGIPLTKYAPQVLQLGEGMTGEVAQASYRKFLEQYGYHPYMKVIAPQDGQPMKGSNLFIRFGIAHHAEQEGGNDYKLITPAISEEAVAEALKLKAHAMGDDSLLKKLKQFYEDTGLAVFGEQGPNEELRLHLLPQLKDRGFNPEEAPVVVYRAKTVKDDKFTKSAGLRFDLGDDENIAFYAPVLLQPTSNFSSDNPNLVSNGLPNENELGEGDRTLYTPTQKTGLRRLYRGRDLDLGANIDFLPISNEAGRVSFLVGAAPQNSAVLEARVIQAVREAFSGNR